MNPRQMQKAMRSMGITQKEVPGVMEVIIRTSDKDIVITDAEVVCIDMKGQKSYQVTGEEEVRAQGSAGCSESGPAFAREDIELVMSQANCDEETAITALKETDGQPAEAIIKVISR